MLLAQLLVFVLIFQVIIRPLMAAYLFTRPPRLRVTFRAPEEWGVGCQDVQLTSTDGVVLDGWYVPPRNGAAIILLHGLGGNRLAVSFQAETLVREGFGVLLFDLRAHGSSGGRRFSRDAQLIDDVLAAVAFLSRQRDVQGRIGVMGISAGGMMAIQAAARTIAIRAVAADGPILGSIEDLPPPDRPMDRYWRYPVERYYQAAIRWFTPESRPTPSNHDALRRLRGRPILLVSTGQGFERRLTHSLYTAAREPKVWWELPQAYHATGWVIEPEAYARTIVDFFNRALEIDDSPGFSEQPLSDHDLEEQAESSEPPTGMSIPTEPVTERLDEPAGISEKSISPPTAMMLSLAIITIGLPLLLIPYQLRWGLIVLKIIRWQSLTLVFGILCLLLTGWLLRWLLLRLACRVAGWKAGRSAPNIDRYSAHRSCRNWMPARVLRIVLLVPVLSLVIMPGLAAFLFGSWILILWAIGLLALCSGDLTSLYAMRGVPGHMLVRLHPRRPGCQVLDARLRNSAQ